MLLILIELFLVVIDDLAVERFVLALYKLDCDDLPWHARVCKALVELSKFKRKLLYMIKLILVKNVRDNFSASLL